MIIISFKNWVCHILRAVVVLENCFLEWFLVLKKKLYLEKGKTVFILKKQKEHV